MGSSSCCANSSSALRETPSPPPRWCPYQCRCVCVCVVVGLAISLSVVVPVSEPGVGHRGDVWVCTFVRGRLCPYGRFSMEMHPPPHTTRCPAFGRGGACQGNVGARGLHEVQRDLQIALCSSDTGQKWTGLDWRGTGIAAETVSTNPLPPAPASCHPPQPPALWLSEAPVRKMILQMHTPARTRQRWADPRSSQTGQVIRGLR